MKEIFLTQGKVALVDDDSYICLSKFRWYALKHCNTYYAVRHSSTDPVTHKRTQIQMHVAILGTPEGMETDHTNGNGLDNRLENLRVVTHRQNGQNRHTPKTSKFPGVYWNKQCRKWRALIQINGKKHHLGYYDDEEMAGIVYSMACNALKMNTLLFSSHF